MPYYAVRVLPGLSNDLQHPQVTCMYIDFGSQQLHAHLQDKFACTQADLSLLADLPEGIINVVPGEGDVAGAALAAHPGINHVRALPSMNLQCSARFHTDSASAKTSPGRI